MIKVYKTNQESIDKGICHTLTNDNNWVNYGLEFAHYSKNEKTQRFSCDIRIKIDKNLQPGFYLEEVTNERTEI